MVKKLKHIGSSISFKNRGKRVSGTVQAVRKEFYWVKRGNKLYKVDRHSIFTALGSGIGRVAGGVVDMASAGYQSYQLEREQGKEEIEKIKAKRKKKYRIW